MRVQRVRKDGGSKRLQVRGGSENPFPYSVSQLSGVLMSISDGWMGDGPLSVTVICHRLRAAGVTAVKEQNEVEWQDAVRLMSLCTMRG